MPQLNINVTEDFQKDLEVFMKATGIETKSEAIKHAIKEAAKMVKRKHQTDFKSWLGAGLKAPPRTKLKFKSHDDIWKAG